VIMGSLVSLVMTVYNRERYLGTAIESVLRQTYRDFELIVWDDGSTDRSVEIAQEYAAQDGRVQVIAAAHQGRAGALKAAHGKASGDYVGWIDSDDALAAKALALTVARLAENPGLGMVYTNYLVIDGVGKLLHQGARCQIPYSADRLLQDFMTFHFRLMRQAVFDAAGGIDERFDCMLDYDLCLRLSEVTMIEHLPENLYFYRAHGKQMFSQMKIEQILTSQRCVQDALVRRGMASEYETELEIFGRVHLRKK
jgi:glycosyltransferase involved in cell wall biosynthesis